MLRVGFTSSDFRHWISNVFVLTLINKPLISASAYRATIADPSGEGQIQQGSSGIYQLIIQRFQKGGGTAGLSLHQSYASDNTGLKWKAPSRKSKIFWVQIL